MSKKKYYVVWNGRSIGVYHDWSTCEEQVKGYPNAAYKGFESLTEAEAAFFKDYEDYIEKGKQSPKMTQVELKKFGQPILQSICVDAAFNGATKVMEYRGVDLEKRIQIFLKGPYQHATNNIGEFLAIVHALAWMKNNGDTRPIYSDSITAIAWIKRKQANTKLKLTDTNQETFELVTRAENWLKNNTYSNKVLKWETQAWGENPADFGRK